MESCGKCCFQWLQVTRIQREGNVPKIPHKERLQTQPRVLQGGKIDPVPGWQLELQPELGPSGP